MDCFILKQIREKLIVNLGGGYMRVHCTILSPCLYFENVHNKRLEKTQMNTVTLDVKIE